MSESLSIDEGWEEPLDSEQVTHVKGEAVTATAASGEWLVNVSEQVVVPMTTTDVVEALRAQRITGRSLVWRTGMQDWTPLGEVPPLRLAAGPLATQPARAPAPVPAPPAAISVPRATQPERLKGSPSERVLHPPPKEPARAARDERRRRNTLPFGFPVVRDPASVRQPTGLHGPAPTAVAAPEPSSRPRVAEVEALAIYERATPSLTFSDSVRAEWQGTTGLVRQPTASAAPPPSAPSAAPSRPEPKLEPKPRLSLEPQSDPKPRLTLEPQSDPMQSARVESPYQISSSQPPNSLAPITSEPENELPVRGAGLWGDLSVVLASDLRAVQASSKRLTLIASLGSAALASLLTLWFAHSSTRHAPPEAAPAAQAQAVEAPAKAEGPAVPAVVVVPAATLTPPATSASVAHAQAAVTALPSSPPVAVHIAPKPAVAAPRVAARPKPAPARSAEADADSDTPSVTADPNPYADSPEHSQPKTPTAAFKETSTAPAPKPDPDAVAPSVASGLEDSAKSTHPAPTATPGF
jgi:hypothetical protein